ncbi:MAG: polysaccharide pyruvyl transferase family protein [Oligoflexia bacterium]|nr:polysaccharide pyruvyl transferase family protein [Oligoflexia bacterium]
MLKSVTLLGSSSGRNAGDAALISGIMDSIDRVCDTNLLYEIPTIRPSYITNNYPNRVQPIGMMPWDLSVKMLGVPTYRSIMRTDLSLIFDAILFDRALYNPLFNFLSTIYLMLPLAKKRGKRVGMYNVGVGPITTPAGEKMLRTIADLCDFITVRDQGSLDVLLSCGVTNPRIVLTADAALNVDAPPDDRIETILQKVGLSSSQEILGLNVSAYLDSWAGAKNRKPLTREQFVGIYSAALSRVAAQINAPILFVGTQVHDASLSRELAARIRSPKPVTFVGNEEYNHLEIRGVLSKLALLYGMRLHSIILASAGFTPVCGLPHQPKVGYYFETMGLDQFNMNFEDFSEEAVYQHLIKSWNARAQIRKHLEQRIPVLKAEAFKAAELVATLHRGENIEQAVANFGPAAAKKAAGGRF